MDTILDRTKKLERDNGVGGVDVHALFERVAYSTRKYTTGQLTSSVMHELGQPLTAIVGLSEYLHMCCQSGDDISRDELLESIGEIVAQSTRMVEMVRAVQRFTRNDSRAVPKDIELESLVASVVDVLNVQFSSRGIDLNVDVGASIPSICGAFTPLQEVLYNLLFNAREAIAAQGEQGGQIDVGVHASPDGFVLLSVRDSGEGIDRAIQQRIFEPFFTTRDTSQHAGLGLSAVQHIAKRYGGHVTVLSEPGQGASFTLHLPSTATV